MSIVYSIQFNLLSTDYLPAKYILVFQHTGQVSSTTISTILRCARKILSF